MRTRAVLDESLGLEPSVSLRSLHERVLRQDESLGAQPEMTPPPPVTVPGPTTRARAAAEPVRATNLPTVLRPLIGRDDQLDSVAGLLAQVRLLTLIGPGGAGKTSLALATLARVAADFVDGAFGVRLASVHADDQVPVAVADALGVPLDGAGGDAAITERLIAYLGRKHVLVLVDNCEHVVDAAATLIDDVLASCPHVTMLATSREALAIPDEVQVTVGPLEAPPEGTPAQRVLQYPAAQLFVERARAMRPGSVYDEPDLAAIGRICRALDGIPLAVELAAARTAALSPVEISKPARGPVLPAHVRRPDRRGQAAHAAGHRRLELRPAGRARTAGLQPALGVLRRLDAGCRRGRRGRRGHAPRGRARRHRSAGGAVHAGRRARADHPVPDVGDACDSTPPNSSPPPARARPLRSGTRSTSVTSRSRPRWGCVDTRQRATLARLREEQPNLRAAVAWLGGAGGDLDSALTMAGALGLFWHLGRHLEGRELLARLLARTAHPTRAPAARASALQAVSLVERPRACLVHPSPRCAETAAESLELFERLGDPSRAALSRVLLAVQGVTGADRERCEELLRRGRATSSTDAGRRRCGRVGCRGDRVRADGDRAQDRRRGRTPSRSGGPRPRRSGSSTTRGGSPRSCTTSGGGCGSSAATPKPPGCSRRRSTSPPAPACTTPCSGRWPTSASPSSTSATRRLPATCSTARRPPSGAGRRRRRRGAVRVRVRPSRPGARGLGRSPGPVHEAEPGSASSAPRSPRASPWPGWPGATRPTATWCGARSWSGSHGFPSSAGS